MSPPNNFHFFQKLAEQANQVFFGFNPDSHQFLYINPFFEQIWQQEKESVMENPASLLTTIHSEDKDYVIKNFQELLQGIDKKDIEFQIYLDDQTVRWVSLTAFLYEEPSGQQIIAGFVEDISEWKKKNDILKKYASKKNAVLEILSHDLAGPLASIQGLSALAVKRLKPYENKEINDLMEKISSTCKQGIHLIREFVKQEFLESVQVDLIKKRIDIVRALREVMEQYQDSRQETNKTFHFFSDRDALNMQLDDVKFMQVINNLISNAIKFTPDGGVITVRLKEEEEHVFITVEDNGIGIPDHLQKGLFDKFPKARRPGLKGEPSTGLGMSIIKTIVDWHHGEIWFESQENKGTTFYIKLPKE